MASAEVLLENEVKNYIKGILTSTPQVSTLRSLQRDYRELIGEDIPFYKLRYNSLEHFLKTIPDVCTVNGSGPFAQVYPVIDEKIAHINKLVTSQRISTKGKRKPLTPRRFKAPVQTRNFSARRSGFNNNYSISPYNSSSSNSGNDVYYTAPVNKESRLEVPQSVSQPVQTKNVNVHNKEPHLEVSQSVSQPSQAKNVNVHNASSYSEVLEKRERNKLGGQLVRQKLDNLLENKLGGGYVSTVYQLSTSNVDKSNNNQIIEKVEKLQISDSNEKVHFQQTKGSHTLDVSLDEDISNVPNRVQSSLKTLINLYEDGIWVSDLPTEYRKLFKKDLSFMDYGYTSLIEMCVSLKHIFHYVRPGTDDFKLYDRSKPLPSSAETTYTIASYDVGEKTTHYEALPELNWSDFKGYVPTDVFEYGKVIPNQFLPEGTKVDTVFDVVVVEIYDPSKFWFYVGTSDTPAVLDKLMDELQVFYKNPENVKEYSIPPGALKEGLYCVQVVYGEYHRARVVKVLPENRDYVRVLYIDYGTVTKAPVEGMCFLHAKFASLPAQAIRCRLTNIVPVQKGHPWPRSASDRFREMVNRRDTKIKISYIDWREQYVCVFLADVTDSQNIFYINEMLVKEGHAVWDGEKQECPFVLSKFKCKVQNIHLFPTFPELEYGLAPSATEMYSLSEMLVPLHVCIPQYFELDEQIVSEDESADEMETSFIETVKNHRKFATRGKIDVGALVAAPTIDFNVFGGLKDEMIQFCNRMGLIGSWQIRKEDCSPDDQGLWDCDDHVEEKQAPTKNIEDFEPVRMLSEDRKLTESILQKLEKYRILESETSADSDCDRDGFTQLVPQESRLDYSDVYRDHLTTEEIVEYELATIFENSETELESLTAKLPNRAADTERAESDINIFDNPEAFEDAFSDSSSGSSPVSPLRFLKNIEFKFNRFRDVDESDVANQKAKNPFKPGASSSSVDLAKSHISIQTETDFNRITTCSEDIRRDQNTLKASTSNNSGSEASCLEGFLDKRRNENRKENEFSEDLIDLHSCQSTSDDSKNTFVNSLSRTNPFREYLCEELDRNVPAVCSTNGSPINSKCQEEPPSKIKEVGVQTSKYNTFVPINNSCETASAADTFRAESSLNSTPSLDKNTMQQMSINAAPFVPTNFTYPQWSNGGGYPVPHYPQWSDGNNYPAPYPFPYLPNPRVRPPPGFAGPYQGIPQSSGHQFNPYYGASRMGGPAVFPQYRGPPGYYMHPRQMMGAPAPGIMNAFGMQDKDFYERLNEVLTNKNSGQS